MKIRKGFVSNSSSSSYIAYIPKSKIPYYVKLQERYNGTDFTMSIDIITEEADLTRAFYDTDFLRMEKYPEEDHEEYQDLRRLEEFRTMKAKGYILIYLDVERSFHDQMPYLPGVSKWEHIGGE
ncbi:MAG: hypothetical protein INQ03_09830 [Candidatus Heimdallarchaeota archaeon]|nr:hypothetical protein [Candidatus Heimdallarchaeota archaeon]